MKEEQKTETEEKRVEKKSNSITAVTEVERNKIVVAIVAVLILILGALEFSGTIDLISQDKVVATVNGDEVTQSEFDTRLNQILASPQAQALNIDDEVIRAQVEEQVLNEIINTKLLLSAAVDAGFAISDDDVETEYNLIVERLGSAELLAAELQSGGLTDKEFRNNIKEQLIIQQYIDDNIDPNLLVVSDEEIAAFYEQISGQEGLPPLPDIKPQIEGQLLSQKQQTAVGEIISNIRASSDITITE